MAICPFCGDESPKLGARCTATECANEQHFYIYENALKKAETDPRIGTIAADKYVIVGQISKGGMGAVYRAIQQPVEREVAFKVLRTEMEDSDQVRDRFIREARAISTLNHSNIITLFDFGFEASGHPYMVMEYAPGTDLGKWSQNEDVTTERVIRIIQQLLSALDEAHTAGIVHRDLKPENMIVTSKANDPDFVKLLDFGIARLVNETSTRGLTREGEVFGTPHYMAPEQAQGAKNIDAAADVYAVGIMMYELLCGEAPFDAPTPLAVLLMHINEPLPELHPRPGVVIPPELAAFVARACSKDATARFRDAGEMLGAMNALYGQAIPGYATGAVGAVGGDLSGQFARPSDSGLYPRDTIASSSSPNIPSPSFGVAVNDPDPSLEIGFEYEEPREDNRKLLAILGVVTVCVLLGLVGVGFAITSGDKPEDGPDVVKNGDKPDETTSTIAAKADVPDTPEVDDPKKGTADTPATNTTNNAALVDPPDATNNATNNAPDPTGDPEVGSDKTEPDPKKTTRTARKTPRKTPRKTKPTEDPKDEPKDEPKKFEPKKFEPKKVVPKKFGTR